MHDAAKLTSHLNLESFSLSRISLDFSGWQGICMLLLALYSCHYKAAAAGFNLILGGMFLYSGGGVWGWDRGCCATAAA